MNQQQYINKNGKPALCWIAKPKHKRSMFGGNKIDVADDVWYVRSKTKCKHAIPSLVYTANSYIEARAKQLVFLEKAKRNVKR